MNTPPQQVSAGRPTALEVLIVGCGLGGLSCAISCLREGLDVQMFEKAKELGEIGAGIQIPPNAVRVLEYYGLLEKITEAGAVKLDMHHLLRYSDGDVLYERPGREWFEKEFGNAWHVMHRVEYHRVLLDEAVRLGAKIRLDSNVIGVDTEGRSLTLSGGEIYKADVILGADGLHSGMREYIVGTKVDPVETGDMAYRATVPRDRVLALQDESLLSLCNDNALRNWIGPKMHAVLYPVRHGKELNLVLICPDDVPSDLGSTIGNLQEMRALFKDWDPRLQKILSCVSSASKWKIRDGPELSSWTRASFPPPHLSPPPPQSKPIGSPPSQNHAALLGDACHPTAPYQSQGAAMAIEDGAALGILLGALSRSTPLSPLSSPPPHPRPPPPPFSPSIPTTSSSPIPPLLRLYESLRKPRATLNVLGARANQSMWHMCSGPERDERDAALRRIDIADPAAGEGSCGKWSFVDRGYQLGLLGADVVGETRRGVGEWMMMMMMMRR